MGATTKPNKNIININIIDEHKKTLVYAEVKLLNKERTEQYYGLTSEKGIVSFTNVIKPVSYINVTANEYGNLFIPINGKTTFIIKVNSKDKNQITYQNFTKQDSINFNLIHSNKANGKEEFYDKPRTKKTPIGSFSKSEAMHTPEMAMALEKSSEDRSVLAPEGMDVPEDAIMVKPTGERGNQSAKTGLLTAAEVFDFNKWTQWKTEVLPSFKNHVDKWQLSPTKRYTIQLLNQDKNAVISATVKLMANATILFEAVSDNTGKAELYENSFDVLKATEIIIEYKGQSFTQKDLVTYEKGIMSLQLPIACETPNIVEVSFIVDATGSMGDEINYLKAEIKNIIEHIKDVDSKTHIRTNAVFYRDYGDEYLVRNSGMSDDLNYTNAFIQKQHADGGGDFPEALDDALYSAVNETEWTEGARTKIAFIILDAPPHNSKKQIE